jgi:hypothetical protein
MGIITLQSSRTFCCLSSTTNYYWWHARSQRSVGSNSIATHIGRLPGSGDSWEVQQYCRCGHAKWAADERVAIALLSSFRQLAQIAVEGGARHKTPSPTVCLGYCTNFPPTSGNATILPCRPAIAGTRDCARRGTSYRLRSIARAESMRSAPASRSPTT